MLHLEALFLTYIDSKLFYYMRSSCYEVYHGFTKGFVGTFKLIAILVGSLLSLAFIYILYFILAPVFSIDELDGFMSAIHKTPNKEYQTYVNLVDKKLANWDNEVLSPLFSYFGTNDDPLFLQNWHEDEIAKTLKVWLSKYNKEALLLYGPPGNGKSRFVAAAANHEKAILITLTPGQLFVNKNKNGSHNIRLLFNKITNLAQKYPEDKFILFIDELDRTLSRDNIENNHVTAATELISQLDNAQRIKNLLICFATNLYKHEIDSALSRPGRSKLVLIDNPHSIKEIALVMGAQLKMYTKLDPTLKLPNNLDNLILNSLTKYFGAEKTIKYEISRATYNQVLSDIIFLKKLEEENLQLSSGTNVNVLINQEFMDRWVGTIKTQYAALNTEP